MIILGVDPGPTQSAWVVYHPGCNPGYMHTPPGRVYQNMIEPNEDFLRRLATNDFYAGHTHAVFERVESFGMKVGVDGFETVFWTGRFFEACLKDGAAGCDRIGRKEIKLHLCQSPRAKDPNITQALVDKFAGVGGMKAAKGTKQEPGPLHGFKKDIWSALAVAVTYAETHQGDETDGKETP